MTSIKVVIKLRPLIPREKDENLVSQWSVVDEKAIKSNNKQYNMTFDKVFDETRSTQEIFQEVAKPIVTNALKGINGTIFAYGQTSSGKTYCMMGSEENPGVVPLAIDEIFKQIETMPQREFLIRVGYIEIYNEKIYDLLEPEKTELTKLRETNPGEVSVQQTEVISSTAQSILETYAKGNVSRRVGETGMNDQSSRSHSIFRIVIESKDLSSEDGIVQVSTLNLVDLAGSERADQTKATGERLREGGCINKSLLALSKVIRELSDIGESSEKLQHIPYRDSKLTRILSASLGGNAQTAIICTVTPASLDETFSTLTFASNAKKIKNRPKINESVSDQVIMNRLRKEIAVLKKQLDAQKTEKAQTFNFSKITNKILELELSFVNHPTYLVNQKEVNRRRTWCHQSGLSDSSSKIPLYSNKSQGNVILKGHNEMLPPPPPFVLFREGASSNFVLSNGIDVNFDEEEFTSSENVNLDRTLSPVKGARNTDDLKNLIHTPRAFRPISFDKAQDRSPMLGVGNFDPYERIKELEQEIDELKDFKLVEEYTASKEECNLQEKLNDMKKTATEYECKIAEFKALNDQKDVEIEKLRTMETKQFLAEKELKKALEERQFAENNLASSQYEFDQFKVKAKNRETELLGLLEEARDESKVCELNAKITKLQELLKKTEEELFAIQANAKTDYITRIKELENENQQIREYYQSFKEKVESLQQENIKLSDQLLEAVQDAENLQQNTAKLEAEITSKNGRIDELEQDQSKLMDEMLENSQEAEKLQKDFTNLQSELDARIVDNKTLSDQILDCSLKITTFERIQEMLINGNVEEIQEDDDFGKIILKMHHNSSKTESLELEKLQLLEQIESIRATVVILSDQLVVSQNAAESEQQLKHQVELLSNELVKTKSELDESVNKLSEQYTIIDELRCQLENKEGASNDCEVLRILKAQLAARDVNIDELKQQIEKLSRENTHMAATLDECESLEAELENLTKEKIKMQNTIDDLLLKIPAKPDVQDRSMELFSDSFANESVVVNSGVQIESLNAEINELKSFLAKDRQQIQALNEEKSSLTDKIQEYESEIVEKVTLIESLTQKLQEIESDEKLSDTLKMMTTQYESLKASHADVFNDHNKIMEQAEELSESNDKLYKELEELKLALNTLKQERDEFWQKVVASVDENNSLKLKLNDLVSRESDHEKKEKESMEKDDKITELEGKIQSLLLKNDQNSTDDDKTKLENELVEIKSQNETLVDQYSTTKAISDELKLQLESAKLRLTSLETQIRELNKEHTETKSLLDDKMASISSLEAQLKMVESNLSEKSDVAASLETQLSSLCNELSHAKSSQQESDAKIQELEDKIAELQNNLKNSQVHADYNEKVQEIQHLKEEIKKVLNENSGLGQTIFDHESTIELLTDVQKTMKDEHDKLVNEKNAKNAENEICKLKICDLEKQASEFDSRYLQLDAKVTNYESAIIIKDEKIAQLESELNKVTNEFEDAKTRLRRRSVDTRNKTDSLEAKISDLMRQLGETEALKAATGSDLKKVNSELAKITKERDCLRTASDENDLKYTVLDEKYSQLSEINGKLEREIKALKLSLDQYKRDVESLNTQLSEQMSENFTHSKTVGELREKCETLTQQLMEKKKLSVSPRSRRSSEHDSDALYSLQKKHLMVEANSGTPVRAQRSIQERKSRRQSVHDDNRRLSLWEKFQDVETQTDASSDLCACNELREKLKKITIDLKIGNCKIANFERMANANPLKIDLWQAQQDYDKERRAHAKCKESLDEANKKIEKLSNSQKVKVEHVTRSLQVGVSMSNFVEKTALYDIQNEKNALKRQLAEADHRIRQLEEEKKETEKENISQNAQNTPGTEGMIAQKLYDEVLRKYDMAKRLCNVRYETIQNLTQENSEMKRLEEYVKQLENKMTEDVTNVTRDFLQMKQKYEFAKEICEVRKKKLDELRAKYGEPAPTAQDSVE